MTAKVMFARTKPILLMLSIATLFSLGCSRSKYRKAADQQSLQLISSRNTDHRWALPLRPVEPASESRLSLPANLDCAPKPPDDPASLPLMYCPDGHANHKYWDKIANSDRIESTAWLDSLPRKPDGSIELNQQTAIDLALLHSRDYQRAYESVYLTALQLTENQFEFETQWNGGLGTEFLATGKDLGNNRILSTSDRLGFNRSLAGGGQLATNVLNSFFWDFGANTVGSSGAIVSTFTQPLLRGAFRHVRLESLTQAERNLLYEARNFARFRRALYFDVSGDYLRLLTQKQSIRNAKANIESLRSNLVEHEEMKILKMVSQIQVDQIYQEYQNGRLTLLAAEQNLVSSLDQFKFQIGLPPWVPFEVDESPLKPFELISPELEELDREGQTLYRSLLRYTPTISIEPEVAPKEFLYETFDKYKELHDRVAPLLPPIANEHARWQAYLDQAKSQQLSENDKLDFQQQQELANKIAKDLKDLEHGLANREKFDNQVKEKLEAYDNPLPTVDTTTNVGSAEKPVSPKEAAWRSLYALVNGTLREEISNLYIYQTQIRLFLIDLPPINVEQEVAVTFAHQNRLDQMNRQAQVMDAYRKIEVAADALQSTLTLQGQVALGTDPGKNNAFRLDSGANSYRAGVQFDGPLNRLRERNDYRGTQIAYQQATRNYVAGKDIIANEIRAALRQLELRRLNFQIARQQLVSASRQVDQALINLRIAQVSSTNLTRDLLQSLQGLLSAKNNLISNWIDYKVLRIGIFASLELLYMDENGMWINEDFDLQSLKDFVGQSDYFPLELSLPQVPNNDSSPPGSQSANAGDDDPPKEKPEANKQLEGDQTAILLPAPYTIEEESDSTVGRPKYSSVISLAPPPILK
jgi:outer membrane protein TolC